MGRELWACLRLPALALDATLRSQPQEQRARPQALLEGPPQQRRLHAVNAAAAGAGLQPGQSLALALTLCPQLAAAAPAPGLEQRSRELLAAWAWQYSAQVAIAPWPDALLLEVGASLGLFGPWPRLAARLRRELAALGFTHRLVLAPNPQAAHALAARHELLAVPEPEALARALAALPVACCDLPGDAAARLQGMGLRRLGQLLALPRAALRRRFGAAVVQRLDQLRGATVAQLPLWSPPPRFHGEIEFQRGVHNVAALRFPLRRLCADLAAFLTARDGGVQRFTLRLEHEDHAPSTLQVGLLAPERRAATLLELARQRLERMALPAPVTGIALDAAELPPFRPAHADLFSRRPTQALDWTELRERLRARLGDAAVRDIGPVPDHRPERAWHWQAGAREAAPAPQPPRPAWLLARPIPLRGPPPRILAGPERIESGWWDGGDTRRDYYVVELPGGQRAWVFCPLGERGPFQLHGWFA